MIWVILYFLIGVIAGSIKVYLNIAYNETAAFYERIGEGLMFLSFAIYFLCWPMACIVEFLIWLWHKLLIILQHIYDITHK